MITQPDSLRFHAAFLPREEVAGAFLVRHRELEEILAQIRTAPADDSPQHLLVLGKTGMGKTLLLQRLARAVEDDRELAAAWLPVLFNEDQQNIGDLADFWLNALVMVAVATGDETSHQLAEELVKAHRGDALEEAARKTLQDEAQRLGRRFLLLVDNLNGVLGRIGPDVDASRLREVLQHEPWVMLVGTSRAAIRATYEYDQPFYQMFRVMELAALSEDEAFELLEGLSNHFGADEVLAQLYRRRRPISKLNLITGCNPRTVTMLFSALYEGPDRGLWSLLERLLDLYTDFYRSRLERLPRQARRIVDAMARRWAPCTAEKLAGDLRLARSVVSGQLHRLVEWGVVDKINLPSSRGMGFQVRDRLFNLWCLMCDNRGGRWQVEGLVEFIELFYAAESFERLDAPEEILEQLRGDLESRGIEGLSWEDRRRLLSVFVQLVADGATARAQELLWEIGLDRRWLPLAHALTVLTEGRSWRREIPALEVHVLSEDVLTAG